MTEPYHLDDDRIAEYFATAKMRYHIYLRRQKGDPPPWTADKAFQQFRFCNVFREDDRTTIWIRENVREPMRDDVRVLTAMTLARFTNRISTMEKLLEADLFRNWDVRKCTEVLKSIEGPIVTGAYIVNTPRINHTGVATPKSEGIPVMVDKVAQEAHLIATSVHRGQTTMRELFNRLMQIQGSRFGPFMAYEVVTDLSHTWMLDRAPDLEHWANPGPGACAGLSWLHDCSLESITWAERRADTMILPAMRRLLVLAHAPATGLWPEEWPRWSMREVEHWLCEYAKWVRFHKTGGRLKRRFNGS